MQQVAQVGLERSFFLLHGFYALFREGETTKEKHHAHYGNNHHGHKPTKLWSSEPATHWTFGVASTESVYQRHKEQQGYERTKIGEGHAVSGQRVAVCRVGTHHA